MIVEAQVNVNGPRAAIWKAITDIDNAATTTSGIEKIEVLERPASGVVGLRWLETRMLFGKPAAVEKWITDAAEGEFYRTRAESDGFIFLTTKRISESDGAMTLAEAHESRPQTVVARFMSVPMLLLFKGAVKKALLQDLDDIRAAVERAHSLS